MSEKQLPDGIEWPRFEDGELMKLGDMIYLPSRKRAYRVNGIYFDNINNYCATDCGYAYIFSSSKPVLRPPVLDKDGKEIKVGDTVWQEVDGTKLRVIYFGHKEDGERMVGVERISGPTDWAECRSLSLTHTPPDSWEKLREDARKSDYWGCKNYTCEECPALIDGLSPDDRYDAANCFIAAQMNILARAEKLAGVMGDE